MLRGGKWQALGKQARWGNGSMTSGLAKVSRLKQGGRAPFALLQERGVGHCGFPGTQPVLCLRCFTTVPNLGRLKATSGVTHPNCLRRRLGGMEPNHSSVGGEQAGLW